jgi:hypothetical protein
MIIGWVEKGDAVGVGQTVVLKKGHLYRWRAILDMPCSAVAPLQAELLDKLQSAHLLEPTIFTGEPSAEAVTLAVPWPTNKLAPPKLVSATQCVIYIQATWDGVNNAPLDTAAFNTPGIELIDIWDQTTGEALVGDPPTSVGPALPPPAADTPPAPADPPPPSVTPPATLPSAPAKKSSMVPVVIGVAVLVVGAVLLGT